MSAPGPISTAAVACTQCKQTWPATLEFFPRHEKKKNGLCSLCRECVRKRAKERMAERRRTEPEKVKAEHKRHRLSPKGRASKRQRSLIYNHKQRAPHLPFAWTAADWQRCLEFWEAKCAYCGRAPVEQDHVIPLADPSCPGTVPWNIAPACLPCNRAGGRRPKIISARLAAYLDALRPPG